MTASPDSNIKAIAHLKAVWESHAQDDPLWAILSDPNKKGGRWDLSEFLKTGCDEIDGLLRVFQEHNLEFNLQATLVWLWNTSVNTSDGAPLATNQAQAIKATCISHEKCRPECGLMEVDFLK